MIRKIGGGRSLKMNFSLSRQRSYITTPGITKIPMNFWRKEKISLLRDLSPDSTQRRR